MLQSYEKTFDRITTRLEKPLEIIGRTRYNITTSDDPVIAQVSYQKQKESVRELML
jgi:translation initiation factor 3 subunit D